MRADRQIAILLMMQERGRVTAAEIADELEISVRTARRDLEGLGMAGLPVYSQAGRGGGWQLLGDGRTDLTGLSTPEAQALITLLLNLTPLPDDAGTYTTAAIRKLVAALPATVREPAMKAAASTRVVPGQWGGSQARRDRPPAHRPTTGGVDVDVDVDVDGDLVAGRPTAKRRADRERGIDAAAVRDAITTERRAELVYRARTGKETTRDVDPLGIVHKRDHWYLVAGTADGQRTFRLDRIERLTSIDEPVRRPSNFDLDAAWHQVERAVDAMRRSVAADVVIDPASIGRARSVLGDRLETNRPLDLRSSATESTDRSPSTEPAITGRVYGRHLDELAALLAGLHPAVTVVGPRELRRTLADMGRRLASDHSADHPAA